MKTLFHEEISQLSPLLLKKRKRVTSPNTDKCGPDKRLVKTRRYFFPFSYKNFLEQTSQEIIQNVY